MEPEIPTEKSNLQAGAKTSLQSTQKKEIPENCSAPQSGI